MEYMDLILAEMATRRMDGIAEEARDEIIVKLYRPNQWKLILARRRPVPR